MDSKRMTKAAYTRRIFNRQIGRPKTKWKYEARKAVEERGVNG